MRVGAWRGHEASEVTRQPFAGMAERACLVGILVLAAGLRLWGLRQNGYGNLYYAAGVRSMLAGWRNFWFAAYDPAGFVALDKPPVAFWVQAGFAKLFGFSGLSLLLPQALAGVVAVAVLHRLVARVFGSGAALLAALTLAITPVAVAVDRVNNTDSLLALVLVLAAWPMLRAAETGRLDLLLLGMALVGVGFNVKMLAAYVVLPAFVLVYLLTAPLGWRGRLGHLAAATGVMVVVSFAWTLTVDLTPPEDRPYVGDSHNNTELDLIVGYNGIARFVPGTRSVGFGGPRAARPGAPPALPAPEGSGPGGAPAAGPPGDAPASAGDLASGALVGPPGSGSAFFPPLGGRFGGGPPGPLRFARRGFAGQITWLVPIAVLGLVAAATQVPWRRPADPRHQALLCWAVWVVSGGVVFSSAGGMFHPFYVVTMAPALAALVGAGVVALWTDFQPPGWRGLLLPASLLLTAAWQAYILGEYPDWRAILLPWLGAGAVLAIGGLIAARLVRRAESAWSGWALGALATGLLAVLISPMAWALTPIWGGGPGGVPAAGPDLLVRGPRRGGVAPGARDVQRLVEFLKANRRGERFLLATANAMQASPIIVQTGEPVMPIGGWGGGDPILTVGQFRTLLMEGQVRYVLLPGAGGGQGWSDRLAGGRNGELYRWVMEHGKPVDPALWRDETGPPETEALASGAAAPTGPGSVRVGPGGRHGWRGGFRAARLYDCQPRSMSE
jgi:4-amino-4-deoxy-L-arabinose transferase-like glycosyltransferase